MDEVRILPMGDSALTVVLADAAGDEASARVAAFCAAMRQRPLRGVAELVPAFVSATVYYDPLAVSRARLERRVRRTVAALGAGESARGRVVYLPVCYEGAFAPDLARVAEHAGLTEAEVVRLHAGVPYRIRMLGFQPGFPYLGGLDPRLETPRLGTPRTRIEAGSVGIGGSQTGVYPLASPGGWNLIGRTPVRLFDPGREEPVLWRAGDAVVFEAVSPAEYERIRAAGSDYPVRREAER